ncbi:MAG: sialidase family protein [Phycisphaerales bacterium]
MPDGKTLYCVWTIGHGGTCGPMKRSDDGGLTWGDLLPTPASWQQAHNCPAIYRLTDPNGRARLFVFAQIGDELDKKQMVQAVSEDGGNTWSEMTPNGLMRVAMPFCTIKAIDDGKKLLAMTNLRRENDPDPRSNCVAQSISADGGLTWSDWRIALDMPGFKPCEPELIRSPDGMQLACIMRENSRKQNSLVMYSHDEGETWSAPVELPDALTGDRHKAIYTDDGRLVIVFRDMAEGSPSKGSFVAWIGKYSDIVHGNPGEYRLKLLHQYPTPGKAGSYHDCGYGAVEQLPDGTIIATTYVKYRPGPEKNSVVSVRFTLDELSGLASGATTP